jgi:MFS transporter, DHA1 family, inner membrane transport protein
VSEVLEPAFGGVGRPRVASLATATFAVGTDAFVVAGILPEIAGDLRVTVATAGQLVTVFALAAAVLAPPLAALTGSWPRRRVLLAALGVFVLGNVATAVAPTFGLVLASRVLAAAGAALTTPTASVTAAALVPASKRASAIAVATAGLTVATALGAPLDTSVGAVLGWRGTLWFVAVIGLLAAGCVAALVPEPPRPAAVPLRERLAPLRDRRVAGLVVTALLLFIGVYLIYTYLSVIFAGATGSDGRLLAVLLMVLGVAGTVGNLLAGHLADRIGPRAVVALAGAALVVISLLAVPGGSALPTAVVISAVYGLAAFSVTTPQQLRLIALRPGSAALPVSLNASFLYLAISVAGGFGGVLIAWLGGRRLGVAAALFVLLGIDTSELAHRRGTPTSG